MEAEISPTSIEQRYEYATNLDRHWRKNRREKILRSKKENRNQE